MALPATTVWEVRTTGDDTNGGGFSSARSGTDYTLQDAAQLSLTDLACASNTTLTSATGGFTAAMVGNIIQIASGTNAVAGFYEVTAYTSTNQVTIDRTCATGGNMTDGVGKLGGALATPWSLLGKNAQGNTVWIKKGASAYISTSTATPNATRGVCWFGYGTTRGDKERPILRPGANGVTIFYGANTGGYSEANTFRWLEFDNPDEYTGCYAFQMLATAPSNITRAQFCKFTGPLSARAWSYDFCEFNSMAVLGNLYGCVFIDSTISVGGTNGQSATIINCLFDNYSGTGFTLSGSSDPPRLITGNVFYGNTSSYPTGAITLYGASTNAKDSLSGVAITNNIFINISGYAISGQSHLVIAKNAFYNVTSGAPAAEYKDYIDNVELTGDPFVNAANGDFRLNRTAGAGAACRAAGIGPVGQTSYPDIGAVQHGDTTVPAVGDVESGVTFGDGAALTGTFAVPAEEDVKDGVTYGAGGTEFEGTLEGGGGVIVIED